MKFKHGNQFIPSGDIHLGLFLKSCMSQKEQIWCSWFLSTKRKNIVKELQMKACPSLFAELTSAITFWCWSVPKKECCLLLNNAHPYLSVKAALCACEAGTIHRCSFCSLLFFLKGGNDCICFLAEDTLLQRWQRAYTSFKNKQ